MYSVSACQEILAKQIKNLHFTASPVELYEPVEYIMAIGGKRIRPVLVLMGANIFANSIENAIDAAMAVEVFHNFTLLHDDIMDNAPVRRNKTTVHVKWDNNTAILSGDAMLILAYQLIAKTGNLNIIDVFSKTALEVCEGQQYDMNFETRMDVSVDEYLEMIRLKTSALLAASLKIGALCVDASIKDADKLYEFGQNIGLAFQLQDDLLDCFGNTEQFGKQLGGDIIYNKKTFLLINALQRATGNVKHELLEWINKGSFDEQEKVKAVLAIYEKLGIKEITQHKIDDFFTIAIENINKVGVSDTRKTPLLELMEGLIKREV